MIPLNTTGDTVAMLVVAGCVGLIGGIGAGLLEMRRDPKKAKECAGTIASSILLGGIAAVAILYFFPPEEATTATVKGATILVKEYNLTKLVALALIVGSAGASFLLVLQKKTLDIAEAQDDLVKKTADVAKKDGEVKVVKAQASETVLNAVNQATALVKASAIKSTAPAVGKALKKAQVGKPAQVSADAVSGAVEQVDNQVQEVQDPIDALVKEAQSRIYAATEEPDPS
jgi:hypothetical protein